MVIDLTSSAPRKEISQVAIPLATTCRVREKSVACSLVKASARRQNTQESQTRTKSFTQFERKVERCKSTPYEVLAVVEMRKKYVKGARGFNWHGTGTLRYAADQLNQDEESAQQRTGCLARLSNPGLRSDNTRRQGFKESGTPGKGPEENAGYDEWIYRGHLDRLGMHGYWMYKGPVKNLPEANQNQPEFAQEGGTWTIAPVNELPRLGKHWELRLAPPHSGSH